LRKVMEIDFDEAKLIRVVDQEVARTKLIRTVE
jgi:hypothetical protein